MANGLPRFAVPAFIASIAGIGLDLMGNTLAQYWPDAPSYIWASLFWMSVMMIAAFPIWAVWATCAHFLGLSKTNDPRLSVECRGATFPSHVPLGGFYFIDLVTARWGAASPPPTTILPLSHSA